MRSRRDALVMIGGAAFASTAAGWTHSSATTAPVPRDGLRRTSAVDLDVDPDAVRAYLDEVGEAGLELNSFMLYRAGAVAAEGWFYPYRPDLTHMLHSATKSFVGAGVGLAVAEGRISLDDPVLKFFPGRIARPSANLEAMTVEHLLTQTSGHAIGISGSSWRPIKTSWVDEFLKTPVPRQPGSHFAYSSATSYMLSAIVTKVTGERLANYMRPRLFHPLGMTGVTWDVSPENVNPGGNGLSVTTSDLMKLGVLYLEGGRWRGRQVLDPAWVEASGRPQHGNPYGYQWWVSPDNLGYYAAGKFGQFCFVFPQLQAILVTTAGLADNLATREAMHTLAFKHVPAMCAAGASVAGAARLARRIREQRVLPALRSQASPLAAEIAGRTWICQANADGVRSLRVDLTADTCRFQLEDHRGRHVVVNGTTSWREGETTLTGGYLHHEYEPGRMRVVAGARWRSRDQLEMTWQFVESGFRDVTVLTFDGSKLRYDRRTNINSGPLQRPTIEATAADAARPLGVATV